MKNIILKIICKLVAILRNLEWQFLKKQLVTSFAEQGERCSIAPPFNIVCTNPYTPGVKYLHLANDVSIGSGATIFATRAHVYIGNKSFSGPNLTIMTGDHPYDIKGTYMADNYKVLLEREGVDISKYDEDVIIEDDVWMGCNVTILKGVRIGRGAIISACSLVTKDVAPYSIVGGVPAKVIKMRWSQEEIEEHEQLLSKN